ncbi:hypothetical protein EBU71_17095 [bacterium]|jgi:hypothetical protein|nr:hypothetical protein [Candidatus Elulimicrobium humile]
MSTSRCFRLSTGEDVVAELVSQSETHINIRFPLILAMRHTPKGPDLLIVPLIATNPEAEIKIDKKFVMYDYEPAEEIAAQYRQMSTGLITPSSLITG